jgi:hypothetical protein
MTDNSLPQGRKPLNLEWFSEKAQDYSKVTRVEVISQEGRMFIKNNLTDVVVQLQDDARTLKIFIKEKDNTF